MITRWVTPTDTAKPAVPVDTAWVTSPTSALHGFSPQALPGCRASLIAGIFGQKEEYICHIRRFEKLKSAVGIPATPTPVMALDMPQLVEAKIADHTVGLEGY